MSPGPGVGRQGSPGVRGGSQGGSPWPGVGRQESGLGRQGWGAAAGRQEWVARGRGWVARAGSTHPGWVGGVGRQGWVVPSWVGRQGWVAGGSPDPPRRSGGRPTREQTNKHTNKQTHKQTDVTTQPYPNSQRAQGSKYSARGNPPHSDEV